MIGARGVCAVTGKQCSSEKSSRDSVASCYADGQRRQWGRGLWDSIVRVNVVPTLFLL